MILIIFISDTNEFNPWNWLYSPNDEKILPFTLKCPINILDDPPYRTSRIELKINPRIFNFFIIISENTFLFDDDSLLNKKARLSQKTICMISKQGNDGQSYYHYDVHSLYGHSQAFATFRFQT